MEGFAERQARIRQQIEDFKITIFDATGDVSLWAGALSDALIPLAQLMPLLSGMLPIVKGVSIWIFQGAKGLFLFGKGALTALVGVGKLAVTLLTRGATALFYYIGSLVTGGSAQLGFAMMSQLAFASFKTAAVTACRTVSAAIMSIPLIGWIAAAIAAIIALGVYFWNTSAKFRATLKGLWAAFKAVFSNIWEMAKTVFSGIGDLIKAAFSLDGDGISAAISKMTGAFSKFGKETGNAFKEAYDQEMKESAEAEKSKGKGEGSNAGTQGGIGGNVDLPIISTPGGGGGGSTDSSSRHSGGGGSSKAANVTIHIGKLVDNLTIKTSNLSTDPSEVKGIITELLISAVNDANLAIQ